MPGQPQVRESGWLYAPDDDFAPIAHVRLEEHADGAGWDVHVADPATAPSMSTHLDTETEARTLLDRIYKAGQERGQWRVTDHPAT
ncbi:hypothetical protein ABT336_13240 [Micromonospora sp. NPDC000207]|uniref:hypothetical protein n=1 Tax=Micromonospora sp. NPDC000207 TaxID=3154246 RepID=UPI003332B389